MERRVPKNPFDDDEAFAKPPRAGSGGKKTVKTASQDDVDELFSYSSSKPKQGYGEHDEEFVNQAVLDLEKHAVNKSQETTSTLKNCLRVADDTMGVGAQTLVSLHEQGVQIERTHEKAVDLDQHLSRGEKLLGSLGGMFSKPWRPKKTKKITGPMVGRVNETRKESGADREALGLDGSQERKKPSGIGHDRETFQGQINAERETQDDMLDDLSTVLSQMKDMSMDMTTEIDRQSPAIEHLHDDIQELNGRVKRANVRGQRLLRR
jgi:synaptosomal-associated protein 25